MFAMSATVTKSGPYYTTAGSEIKFSDLRRDFRAQRTDGTYRTDSGSVKASDFRRNTSTTATDPVVPDATENGNISTANNWKVSQFRNSIKYYRITQTGTNDNTSSLSSPGFDVAAQSWNSNLNKNIRKWMFLNGTIGSAIISQYAARFDGEGYNLTIDVSGGIFGSGGVLGSITGGNGGPAMYVRSTGSAVSVVVNSGANVYAGGGAGERGKDGSQGSSGTCYRTEDYDGNTNCGGCPGCGGDERIGCNDRGGCNCGKGGCRDRNRQARCRRRIAFGVPGAPGGVGGIGGRGRGYNQTRQDAPNFGESNGPTRGTSGGCNSYGGSGTDGERGGHGGDWADAGGNTTNSGSGGSPGRAITGSNYSVTGTISSATIKGAYQP